MADRPLFFPPILTVNMRRMKHRIVPALVFGLGILTLIVLSVVAAMWGLGDIYGTDADHFKLDTPEELPPKTTITVRVTNNIARLDSLKVQLIFHGLEPIAPERLAT